MIASYKKMDFDIGFSKGTTVWASEGMNLSIAPGSKTKLNIDGLGKNINKKLWGVAIYNIVDVQRDVIFKLEQFIL
ncbi:hypothetical protein FACS1894130_01690 [Spirochaetia bacterium]|nr:hypothetical protein FACS1894130_01690 [Spirochaetia bacterium]